MEPQHLSAGHGWNWIKQGYRLFTKAPLLWIVLLLISFVALGMLSAVPMVGEPLASLLLPVVQIGLMVGCRSLEQGDDLELAHLVSGFQQRTAQLVTLGGISLVSQLLIMALMAVLGGEALVGLMQNGQPVEDPAIIQQAVTGAGPAILLGATLFCVLVMALQYAPMLVYFNQVSPIEAMKLSLRAFINNVGAMVVYFTTFIFLAILASIPMMLGWLILLPLVFTSLYISYRDIFPPVQTTGGSTE